MISKKEFFQFIESTGGFNYSNRELPDPIEIFGIECDDGWLELIAELIRELVDAGWTREVRQIKEKFGGLRFYADGLPENGREIIINYQKRSYMICEICGSDHNVRLRGALWVKTLCNQCAGPWLERH